MRRLFFLVALVSMSLVSEVKASPCLAVAGGPSFDDAGAVFIGTVVKMEPYDKDYSGPIGIARYRVTFKVEYSWKGAGFREIGLPELVVISEEVVTKPDFLRDCIPFVAFVVGKEYLVFADRSADNKLLVRLYNGSKLLSAATEELNELKKADSFFQYRVTPKLLRMANLTVIEESVQY